MEIINDLGQLRIADKQSSVPLVSIVIPTYNRAQDLARALDSVTKQSFVDWEVVVVDNHSSDETGTVVASCRDDRIQLLKIHNQGIIAASRNLGLRQARGRYVAFLDSDDWWTPDKLMQSVQALESGADVVYHDAWIVSKLGQKRFRRKAKTWSLRKPASSDLVERGNALVNSSVVVRRGLLLQIGGLCEMPELVGIEDYDAWIRLAQLNANFVRIPAVLTYYWVGGGNISNPQRKLFNMIALEERHRSAFDLARKSSGGCWLDLARGEATLNLGGLDGVYRLLRPYIFSRAPLRWQIKAALLLLLALVKR